MSDFPTALTYDDVLIVPQFSTFRSRKEADCKTRLTKKISLNIPIVSSNMDTVTEARMAIALARAGGIGIVHRFMSIEDNVEAIKKVKRAQSLIIADPYIIDPDKNIEQAKQYAAQVGVTGLLVANSDRKLQGVLSRRDFLFAKNQMQKVSEIMTPREKLIVGNPNSTFEQAKEIFMTHKIEKLPLVDENDVIVGIITSDDIQHIIEYPSASRDQDGQLLVGGSVGVHGDFLERAQELVKAGVDVLVIDIAHGHSQLMFDAIDKLRQTCGDIQIIAGNIATSEAAKALCERGADGLKVGIGPGSICTTRTVTGCGMPQLTAVLESVKAAKQYGIPVIADGGIQKSGDIVKAIGAGADTVMLGSIFAGSDESPGLILRRGGKQYKVYHGSASFAQSHRRKQVNQEQKDLNEITPEGVESIVNYKGPVNEIISQLIGGLKSGMSYTNSHTIANLQQNCQFVRITGAGKTESGSHDVARVM